MKKNESENGDKRLQSPVESHFAITPASSPANGFSGHVCTDLLQEELDQLENMMRKQNLELNETVVNVEATLSDDTLLSPTDETINMFSRNKNKNASCENMEEENSSLTLAPNNKGEVNFQSKNRIKFKKNDFSPGHCWIVISVSHYSM